MSGLILTIHNNEGVFRLMEADAGAAVARFTEAVHQASEILSGGLTSSNTAAGGGMNESPMVQGGDNFVSVNIFDSIVSRDNTDTFLGVYQRAFLLADDFNPHQHPKLFSTIMLYNLALAYHHAALIKSHSFVMNMKAALRSYKNALGILRRCDGPSIDTRLLLVLAIINNLRHVFAALDRVSDAESCDGMMDSLIIAHDTVLWESGDDMEFFYLGHFCRTCGMNQALSAAAAA